MIESPASILHAIAGAPALDGAIDLPPGCRCWLCARTMSRGVDRVRWEGANFQNQNTAREQGAAYVCEPCAWVCSWVPPPGIVTPPGKKGLNLRLFSHFWHAGEYRYWNKADKPAMRGWLRAPKQGPWFAAIADTGQKHVLPWTPISYGPRGRVRFEERDVWLPDAAGWEIGDDLESQQFRKAPTWKRVCITIMKNDTTCLYMGFQRTKQQMAKRRQALVRYGAADATKEAADGDLPG